MAAQEKGEAEKVLRVKNAEAEAESMHLRGIGIANQRKAIVEGLKDSIREFQEGIQGVSAEEVMSLVIIIQYYDTLREIGANDKTNTLFLPHSPSGLNDMAAQFRDSILIGSLASKNIAREKVTA